MANKKAPGKATKVAKKTKAAVSKEPVRKTVTPSKAMREEERVEVETSARYVAATEAEAAAFEAQLSVADAEKRGHATKAQAVLREVRTWIPIIDRVLQRGAKVRYTPARFAYLLALTDALARELDRTKGGGAGKALSLAEARARAARNELLEALEALVLGNDAAAAELSEARGLSTRAEDVLTSLRSLLKLAEAWLAKTDAASVAIVASVCLTEADVVATRAAADALGTSLMTKTVAGTERHSDTAQVNRLEGRVTFEMAVAMRAFNHAAARGQGEKLVPGPATRHLYTRPSKQPKDAAS